MGPQFYSEKRKLFSMIKKQITFEFNEPQMHEASAIKSIRYIVQCFVVGFFLICTHSSRDADGNDE